MRSCITAATTLAAAMHPACAGDVSLPRQAATERRGWVEPATGSYINERQMFCGQTVQFTGPTPSQA